MIVYEFPLNERVRTLLRIESLYQRAEYFKSRDDAQEHHVAILSLFEILDVAGRADLKSEIMQELERKKHQLDALKGNPSVEQSKLASILDETEKAITGLFTTSGNVRQFLAASANLTCRPIITGCIRPWKIAGGISRNGSRRSSRCASVQT